MSDKKNYAWPATIIGSYDYKALDNCLERYNKLINNRKIAVFGAGIRGTLFSVLLKRKGYEDILFVDNNKEKVGHYINEFPIVSLSTIKENKEKYFIIISTEESGGIRKQLLDEGFSEGLEFAETPNYIYEKFVDVFFDKPNVKTIIMGDCGLADIGLRDTVHDSLADLLEERLGQDTTKVLAVHGMGMHSFYEIVKAHCRYVGKPEKLLVMANFETFTGKHHLLPRSQHVRLFELLTERTGDVDLGKYLNVVKERFSNVNMDYFASSQSAVEKADKNDRIVIKMNYMYRLNLENECIRYMFKLWEFCQDEGIKLSFFIPPANYQYAEQLWGEKFTERYEENCDILKKALSEKNIPVLDLSYTLPSDKFADVCTIDESANYEGRKLLTDIICDFVNR